MCDASPGSTVHSAIAEVLGEVIPLKDREEWDAAFLGCVREAGTTTQSLSLQKQNPSFWKCWHPKDFN